jgi:hypothetical protein
MAFSAFEIRTAAALGLTQIRWNWVMVSGRNRF